MGAHVALIGVSAMFSAEEIECLVRTAAAVVCGDGTDLTSRQRELAHRTHHLIHNAQIRADLKTSLPIQRMVTLAEELNIDPHDLDDLVHDLASNTASDTNNGRLDVQIAYLLDEVGEAETAQAIRSAAPKGLR